ncbi:MAG TPA: hypothetical protein VLB45_03910 [Nitrosopumilaceae archaeon]|nr:hypothetical protein [Nitrosopumilaceae archaeon]
MKKSTLQRFVAIAMIASVLWIPTGYATKTFADEEPVLDTDSVNEVGLRVAFHFREATEDVNTFKNFKPFSQTATVTSTTVTTSGFDTLKSVPKFVLEKVVGWDTPYLYHAVDESHKWGKTFPHDYSEFDVDVTFQRGGAAFRQLFYTDCQVTDYYIYTDFDKEETYNAKTDFVYLDSFTFECRGVNYGNPVYDQISVNAKMQERAELEAQRNAQ